MWLEGFENRGLLSPDDAMVQFLEFINLGDQILRRTRKKIARNAEIYQRYLGGEDSVVLAKVFGLSDRRVRTIIGQERRR